MAEKAYFVTVAKTEETIEEVSGKVSIIQKLKNIQKADPKPIFDHFRNIGIVAALGLGSGYMKSIDYPENIAFLEPIVSFASIVILIISVPLLFINTRYAQMNLNVFFLDEAEPRGTFSKVISTLLMWLYTLLLVALIVMYSLNAARPQIEKYQAAIEEAEKTYWSTEKVQGLVEENKRLRNELLLQGNEISADK
ncbi:hypothetical protein JHW46_06625 [Vibrio splendidus]|nr:hypothetical protein [Vibrio splendidus]